MRSSVDRLLGVSHNETFEKQQIIDMVSDAGIEILFHFEFKINENLITSPQDLEERIIRLQVMLDEIKNQPEYELLYPQIEKFRENAEKYGFQPATRVVILGRVH